MQWPCKSVQEVADAATAGCVHCPSLLLLFHRLHTALVCSQVVCWLTALSLSSCCNSFRCWMPSNNWSDPPWPLASSSTLSQPTGDTKLMSISFVCTGSALRELQVLQATLGTRLTHLQARRRSSGPADDPSASLQLAVMVVPTFSPNDCWF